MFRIVKSLQLSTTDYRSYLPTSKAMAFLFKILIQMRFSSIDQAIWIYAFSPQMRTAQLACSYFCVNIYSPKLPVIKLTGLT